MNQANQISQYQYSKVRNNTTNAYNYNQNINNSYVDTPQEIAFHLISAMGCCQDNSQIQRIQLQQQRRILIQLQAEKKYLASEMYRLDNVLNELGHPQDLGNEINFLNDLIIKLEDENQKARSIGIANLENVAKQFYEIQNEANSALIHNEQIGLVLNEQMRVNHSLKGEIQLLIQKIKGLHDRNNELVNLFG